MDGFIEDFLGEVDAEEDGPGGGRRGALDEYPRIVPGEDSIGRGEGVHGTLEILGSDHGGGEKRNFPEWGPGQSRGQFKPGLGPAD